MIEYKISKQQWVIKITRCFRKRTTENFLKWKKFIYKKLADMFICNGRIHELQNRTKEVSYNSTEMTRNWKYKEERLIIF